MRILHLAPRLSARGGADQHLLALLDNLNQGQQNLLLVGKDDGTARAACPHRVVEVLGQSGLAGPGPGFVLENLERARSDFAPDLIHLHNVVSPQVLDWAADKRALLTVQDHRFFCPGRGKWTASGEVCRKPMSRERCAVCFDDQEYFERIFHLTRARLSALGQMRLSVLSEYMRRELVAVGVPVERIQVIPPFAHNLPLDQAQPGTECALFVGRLVQAKGPTDAVAAHAMSGSSLPLVFAGTGSLRRDLQEQGQHVLGWQSRAQLAGLLRSARVVIMPSRWQEPFGIVGLEAMRAGVPVVAFESGGVAEWLLGPGLVPWGDLPALARAISSLSRKRAVYPAGFGSQELMERLLNLYRKLRAESG